MKKILFASPWRVLALGAMGWYLFEVALHYFLQRPLWNDERCVLLSIQQFAPGELFSRTLLACQVFPRLYLWLIQTFASFFDHSLLSLRFLPLAAMISAFFVWARVARREIEGERLYFLYILSWTASIMLVYYAAELKQYSADVLAAGMFLLFLQAQDRLARAHYIAGLLLLPGLGLFSYAPFFFMPLVLWDLAARSRKNADLKGVLLLVGMIWLAVLGVVYQFDLRLRDATLAAAFPDHFISTQSPQLFFKTCGEAMNNFVSRWFASKPLWVRYATRVFMVLGVLELFLGWGRKFRRNGSLFTSVGTVAPVIFLELLVLSALGMFPSRLPRTALFFFPLLVILTLQFFTRLAQRWPRLSLGLQSAYGLFLIAAATGVTLTAAAGDMFMQLTCWMK